MDPYKELSDKEFLAWVTSQPPGAVDKHLATRLLDRMARVSSLEMELVETKSSIQVNRVGIKEARDAHERLMRKVYHPQSDSGPQSKKLLGFQVRSFDPPVDPGTKEMTDIISAVNRLLAEREKHCIVPVFEGDIDDPNYVNGDDLEDGDVV